jgi:peroxiredoxin Q/BCP
MTIEVGKKAPAFKLSDDAGGTATLDKWAGKWLVLYFYPRDDTPG